MNELFDLTGRVALVTGATKGIGRAVAEGLAQAGAAVVVSSRKQDLCDTVAEAIAAATGRDTMGLACHVGDWDQIPSLVEEVYGRIGWVDVLVNNAGINPAPTPVVDVTLEYWRKLQSVNLEGPLRMSALIAPRMRDQAMEASSTSLRSARTSVVRATRRTRRARLAGGPDEGHGPRVGTVERAGQRDLTRPVRFRDDARR